MEKWTKFIEHEIEFYLNYDSYVQDIKDLILENELDIQWPITFYDEAEGRIYRKCPGTEEQAIQRIAKRDRLNLMLKRASDRLKRFYDAYSTLSNTEQELIYHLYFENHYNEQEVLIKLGLSSRDELESSRWIVLNKILRFYEEGRNEKITAFFDARKAKRTVLITGSPSDYKKEGAL
ncbi:hypothetical protein [Metabacillus sp. FJAT-52054]|uniref:Sigma-70 family RNA polymerase sigma factor n=1 Tax=Metabacillus sediminis TaxID=3117746 RepID=A0ABZ2NMQ4_9BACI